MYLDTGELLGAPPSLDFTFFPDPTKWEPGANSASFQPGGFPPSSPGGATFSVMPAGLVDVSTFDNSHGAGATQAIGSLGAFDVPGIVSWAMTQWGTQSGAAITNLGQVADSGANAGATNALGGNVGDIRVAAWEFPEVTNLVLGHGWQPGTESDFGPGWNIGGDVHLDVNQSWIDDADHGGFDGKADLATVILHEIGHAFGLGHSDVPGAVMNSGYVGAKHELQQDDIDGILAIYGEAPPGLPGGIPEPTGIIIWSTFCGLGLFGFRRLRTPNH